MRSAHGSSREAGGASLGECLKEAIEGFEGTLFEFEAYAAYGLPARVATCFGGDVEIESVELGDRGALVVKARALRDGRLHVAEARGYARVTVEPEIYVVEEAVDGGGGETW